MQQTEQSMKERHERINVRKIDYPEDTSLDDPYAHLPASVRER